MSLDRILEPEAMDTPEEAYNYDSMDHSEVNRIFVDDLIAAGPGNDILDLGTGTAQIPVQLCRMLPTCRVFAVDLAISMLELARYNISVAGVSDRIQLQHADAKQLGFRDGMFSAVISNSIIHHLPEPLMALRQAVRVVESGGLLFFRDLARPADRAELNRLVETYAANATPEQQAMFANSLHAALTVDEVESLVASLPCETSTVQLTSDRHWTWIARKAG